MTQKMSNLNEGIVLSGFETPGSQVHNRHIILVAKTGQKGRISVYGTVCWALWPIARDFGCRVV